MPIATMEAHRVPKLRPLLVTALLAGLVASAGCATVTAPGAAPQAAAGGTAALGQPGRVTPPALGVAGQRQPTPLAGQRPGARQEQPPAPPAKPAAPVATAAPAAAPVPAAEPLPFEELD